jgi:hypothetical protein
MRPPVRIGFSGIEVTLGTAPVSYV